MTVDPWQVTTGLLAMLAGLLVYIGRAQVTRIEAHALMLADHSDRLIRIEERMLTRAALKTELGESERRIMDAITSADRHQTEAIGRVDAKAEEAIKHVDELQRTINGA